MNIIASSAERQAAVEFAKAAAVRPLIVGKALAEVTREPDVADALFTVLETQRIAASGAKLTLLPQDSGLLAQLLAGRDVDGGGKG